VAKTCVFCGEQGSLTREHIWPDWLSKMYLRKGDEKHLFGSKTHLNKDLVRDGTHERPGHLFSLRNRVVCQRCNNGWMSKVESETKPIVVRLISGEKHKLSRDELDVLSFWVAMKVVTAEFAERAESLEVTPPEVRKRMMETRKIPDYFNISMGVHSTGHNSAWFRHSWTMAYSRSGPTPPLDGRQRNAQSIAFLIGPIFFYILNVRLDGFIAKDKFDFGKMSNIHPSKRQFLRWPQKRMPRNDSDRIAFMTQDFTESNEVMFVPELPRQ
jgi:hypothetical protein